MRTRCDGSVVAALLVWMTAAGEAGAHPVPGDPDPGRHRYLLPGPLVSLVVPLRGERGPLTMDVGVELSLHRFVPTNRHIWSQWGYGAFAQAQLGGVLLQSGDTPAPSLHLRLAAGAQATFGPLGAQAGLVTRALSADQAGMLGAFVGLFVTFGISTGGFLVEVPVAHLGGGEHLPLLFVGTITLKWPITLRGD